MSYDPECYKLAEYFLPSGPELERLRSGLAQHIQEEVESWLMIEANRLIAIGRKADHLQ